VTDNNGGIIVTWTDGRNNTISQTDIYAQRVNHLGIKQWSPHGVPICTTADYQDYSKLITDGKGGAIVSWIITRGMRSDVYIQRIDTSGNIQLDSSGIIISTGEHSGGIHTIVSDNARGAIIAWEDSRNERMDIYAQRFDSSGHIIWNPDAVAISTADSDQVMPIITGDGGGGAIIGWYDGRSTNPGIYCQQISGYGFLGKLTGVVESKFRPLVLRIYQNFPNPFNPVTTICYEVPHAAHIILCVYNTLGQLVSKLVDENKPAGIYSVKFDGSHIASGVYLYHLQTGDFVVTKKLLLLK
jgi:hypothetical protein